MDILMCVGDGIGNCVQATPAIQEACLHADNVDVYMHRAPDGAVPLLRTLASVSPRTVSNRGADFVGKSYDIAMATFCVGWPGGTPPHAHVVRKEPHPHTRRLTESENSWRFLLHLLTFHTQELFSPSERGPIPPCRVNYPKRPRSKLRLPLGVPIVAIHAGSKTSGMWRRKRYDRYNLVIAEVWSRRPDVHFVYVGTKTDDFHGRPRTRALDLRGVGNLSHQCSILGCADVLVANDGGLAHVGAAIGVPTYVLFGPTVRKKNLPPTASLIETRATVDCMPCQYTRAKPGGRHPAFTCDHRCMTTIDPAIVAESILNELQEQGK